MARMAASMEHDEDSGVLKLGPGVLLSHPDLPENALSHSPVSAIRLQQFPHPAERGGGLDSRTQAERVAGHRCTAEEHISEVV